MTRVRQPLLALALVAPAGTFLLSVVCALALSGCSNPFSDFYQDTSTTMQGSVDEAATQAMRDPELFRSEQAVEDLRSLAERGYGMVGYARFNSRAVDPALAVVQARKVGAELVLLSTRYTNTVSGVVPFTTQGLPQQVTTHFSGSTWGSGGSSVFSGTATSTVPGPTITTFIPYSVDRFDYLASFWRTFKPAFGVGTLPLPLDARQRLGRNRGVVIAGVVQGSPAAQAGLMRGDILFSIGQHDIGTPTDLQNLVIDLAGQRVRVVGDRSGKMLDVEVQLGGRPRQVPYSK